MAGSGFFHIGLGSVISRILRENACSPEDCINPLSYHLHNGTDPGHFTIYRFSVNIPKYYHFPIPQLRMNGFPLVLIGVLLFAVAYALLKIQGKMKEVTNAIDKGFKSIEDGITLNLLGKDGALTKASTALESSYNTLQASLDKNVTGKDGLLAKSDEILTMASNFCTEVSTSITNGKNTVVADFEDIAKDVETVLQDVGEPMLEVGEFFWSIGATINVDILDQHPLAGLAQPFYDVSITCTDIGNKVLVAESNLIRATNKAKLAAGAVDDIAKDIRELGPKITDAQEKLDKVVHDGISTTMGELFTVKEGVREIFATMESGAEATVKNLQDANSYLDQQINGMFQRKYINGLAVAAVALIVAGVALGV
jgi:hypothetical protein